MPNFNRTGPLGQGAMTGMRKGICSGNVIAEGNSQSPDFSNIQNPTRRGAGRGAGLGRGNGNGAGKGAGFGRGNGNGACKGAGLGRGNGRGFRHNVQEAGSEFNQGLRQESEIALLKQRLSSLETELANASQSTKVADVQTNPLI